MKLRPAEAWAREAMVLASVTIEAMCRVPIVADDDFGLVWSSALRSALLGVVRMWLRTAGNRADQAEAVTIAAHLMTDSVSQCTKMSVSELADFAAPPMGRVIRAMQLVREYTRSNLSGVDDSGAPVSEDKENLWLEEVNEEKSSADPHRN